MPTSVVKTSASRVASRFLNSFESGERVIDHKDPMEDGWVNGKVTPFQGTEGQGSLTPPTRDNQGVLTKPPELGEMEIPGYEWHDKSKSFHSIVDKS
jgi:hypothetical protein